jgi:dimethylargininase
VKALVRRPSSRLADGIVTRGEPRPVDVELAQEQWAAYVAALETAGWETVEVPPADDCPDGVFVEDVLVVYGDVAVVAAPGAASRTPETEGIAELAARLGYAVEHIRPPATLDGGDVLKIDEEVYVGVGGRTNREGVQQLRTILGPLGATVTAVPIRNVLHLKSAVTALPDGSIIGHPSFVPASFADYLAVPEESGAHVVLLGGARLLLAADCPRSAELFATRGYEPVTVDVSEFQKLDGCVTCLSVRLRRTMGT